MFFETYNTSGYIPEKLRASDYGINNFLVLNFVFKCAIGNRIACDARPSIEYTEDIIGLNSTTNKFYMNKGTGVLSGIYSKHSRASSEKASCF